jgi:Icc-related predicted phosphoesterase
MIIVSISDTHNKHKKTTIPECDILIHSGDATGMGRSSEMQDFAKWFENQPAKHHVFVPGNHDFGFEKEEARFRGFFSKTHVLIGESVEIEGLKIYGSPWTPWFHDWAFNFPQNDPRHPTSDAAKHWQLIPEDTNILVTHGPPYGILDMTKRGERVGCMNLTDRIPALKDLILHQFGHIHEDAGVVDRGVAYCNASFVDLYQQAKNPVNVFQYVDGALSLHQRIYP